MLQTKKYSLTSKGKKRGRYREKRLDLLLKLKPQKLSNDASIGKYRVDAVINELLKSGVSDASADGNSEFIGRIRQEISQAAEYSILSARARLVRGPARRRKVKRFFEDLRQIRLRIKRNENVSSWDLLYATKLIGRMDEDEFLLDALQDIGRLIQDSLQGRKLVGEGGNYDWLTHQFIQNIFDLWCEYLSDEIVSEEFRLFNRLIAAGWQDAGLPMDGEEGQRLEEWLADRVRKHFPEGISKARLSRIGNSD